MKNIKKMDTIAQAVSINDVSCKTMPFEDIYRAYSDYVYTVAYGIVLNYDDASEIVQETFVKVYKNLSRFRADADIKTWLYRITVNESLNHIKRNRPRKRVQIDLEQVDGEIQHSNAPDPAGSSAVETMLKILKPDYRACVMLRNVQGLSYQEIADVLNENINTVRTRLRRAREQLMQLVCGGERK